MLLDVLEVCKAIRFNEYKGKRLDKTSWQHWHMHGNILLLGNI